MTVGEPAPPRHLALLDLKSLRVRRLAASTGDMVLFNPLETTRDGPGLRTPRLYLLPARGGGLRRLSNRITGAPVWSPDGKWVAFPDADRIRVTSSDGRQGRTVTRIWGAQVQDLDWSPDGSRILFTAREPPPAD